MIISIATGPWLPVPPIQGGAVPRLWQGVAEEFAARGHQVTILCRAYPEQPSNEVINGVQYIRRGGFPQSPNIWADLLKDLLYAVFTFPTLPFADILVINDFWLPVFAPMRPNAGKIVINANRFPKGQYWLYQKAAWIAAASKPIQQVIAKQFPSVAARTSVIPNPINTIIFSPSPQANLTRQQPVILYVGRLHPEKGVHLLIDAFALLSRSNINAKLRIVGPVRGDQGGGGDSYLQNLKVKAKGLPVEFLDPVFDLEKLAAIYRDADVFCYPSLAEKGESFGVAPLEAMACGIVPVVSDLDCFKDFITHNQNGYCFDHRSSTAAQNLSATLAGALSQRESNRAMSLKARQTATQYSYAAVAERYLADFESLLQPTHNSYAEK